MGPHETRKTDVMVLLELANHQIVALRALLKCMYETLHSCQKDYETMAKQYRLLLLDYYKLRDGVPVADDPEHEGLG